MPKFDERFARQYRYELPPEFPLASPNSGIGHHLSGLNENAQARTSRVGCCCIVIHSFCFHYASEFNTLTLALSFNSLVRVSRRVVCTCHSRQLAMAYHTSRCQVLSRSRSDNKTRHTEVMSSNVWEKSPEHRVTDSRFPLSDFRYFNSPFEVLFNFPSRYLFAIDLSPLSSRGWRLPPILRSTPKERDSLDSS